MALGFLTNIFTKAQRAKKKLSFFRKSRREHTLTHKRLPQESNRILNLFPQINIKWILIPIYILVFCGCLYYCFLVIKAWIDFIPKPYQQIDHVTEQEISSVRAPLYQWKGNTKLTVALVGTDKVDNEHTFIDALGIYSLDPLTNTFAVFIVNPDIKIYVSSMGKEINFRTMLNDKTLTGDKMILLKNALSALLAVKVDRYLLIDKNNVDFLTQEMNPVKIDIAQNLKDPDTVKLPNKNYVTWNKGSQQLVLGSDFLEFMASDSNGRDDQLQRQRDLLSEIPFYQSSFSTFFKLPNIINSLNKIVYTDLSKDEIWLAVTKTLSLSDSAVKKGFTREISNSKVDTISFYPVFTPDLNQIDRDVNNIFFDRNIFIEQAQIEVLNGSSIKGLANSRGRWITNLGARIIRIGNSVEHADVTKIYCTMPDKYPNTIAELERIFNQKAVLVTQDYPNRHVGDIVVELGDVFE